MSDLPKPGHRVYLEVVASARLGAASTNYAVVVYEMDDRPDMAVAIAYQAECWPRHIAHAHGRDPVIRATEAALRVGVAIGEENERVRGQEGST